MLKPHTDIAVSKAKRSLSLANAACKDKCFRNLAVLQFVETTPHQLPIILFIPALPEDAISYMERLPGLLPTGVQVDRYYLLWNLKSVKTTYVAQFGSLGY